MNIYRTVKVKAMVFELFYSKKTIKNRLYSFEIARLLTGSIRDRTCLLIFFCLKTNIRDENRQCKEYSESRIDGQVVYYANECVERSTDFGGQYIGLKFFGLPVNQCLAITETLG